MANWIVWFCRQVFSLNEYSVGWYTDVDAHAGVKKTAPVSPETAFERQLTSATRPDSLPLPSRASLRPC